MKVRDGMWPYPFIDKPLAIPISLVVCVDTSSPFERPCVLAFDYASRLVVSIRSNMTNVLDDPIYRNIRRHR